MLQAATKPSVAPVEYAGRAVGARVGERVRRYVGVSVALGGASAVGEERGNSVGPALGNSVGTALGAGGQRPHIAGHTLQST